MDEFVCDPIIDFYMKMSKSTEYETSLPVFSETMLRLAFKEILGRMRPIESSEILLYRRIILFYYSEKYDSAKDLLSIMECFEPIEIDECFEEYDTIIAEWRSFMKENLKSYLFKEVFCEIMYEWTRRCLYIHGEVQTDMFRVKAIDIQMLLGWDSKFVNQCLKIFKTKLPNKHIVVESKTMTGITDDDLDIKLVFEAVKPNLNAFVREALETNVVDDEGYNQQLCAPTPAKKRKMKGEKLESLDIEILTKSQSLCSNDSKDDEFLQTSENRYNEDLTEPTQQGLDGHSQQSDECVYNIDYDDTNSELDFFPRHQVRGDNHDNDDMEDSDSSSEPPSIIDYDTALNYLGALQAYAVVHGHFKAISLLDDVDSHFRQKKK